MAAWLGLALAIGIPLVVLAPVIFALVIGYVGFIILAILGEQLPGVPHDPGLPILGLAPAESLR